MAVAALFSNVGRSPRRSAPRRTRSMLGLSLRSERARAPVRPTRPPTPRRCCRWASSPSRCRRPPQARLRHFLVPSNLARKGFRGPSPDSRRTSRRWGPPGRRVARRSERLRQPGRRPLPGVVRQHGRQLQAVGGKPVPGAQPVRQQPIRHQPVRQHPGDCRCLGTGLQGLPAAFAGTPATVQGLLVFDPAPYVRQFVGQQIGYVQTVATPPAIPPLSF